MVGYYLSRITKQMLLDVNRIDVPPGQRVVLRDVSWWEFEAILVDLGEHRGSRLAYDYGRLEIMTPLPEHEYSKEIIGDLVKALLEELDREFWCLGSTTFKKAATQGLEPDQCFYIQNEAAVRGQDRIDLAVDPPPDLALEIDITSRTHPQIYAALKVPELWRFEGGKLQINVLRNGNYQVVTESPTFPGLALSRVIPQYLTQSKTLGRNTTVKQFRQWVRESLA